MKVFISHSSKDSNIAKLLSFLLSNIDLDTEIFCSSLPGMIEQGANFNIVIERELSDSDIFIALISPNYLDSKYCLIELGYAYSNFTKKKNYHIFPFSIPPVSKSQALFNTPLSHIQTAILNDKNDIHNFVKTLMKNEIIKTVSLPNAEIIEFINKLNNIIMNSNNILSNAIVLPICSDSTNPDAIQHTQSGNKHIVNFKLFANGRNERPNFISLVFQYPGLFNFYDFLCSNPNIKFICTINNYTESLTNIDIEFKHHETHLLKSYKFILKPGINELEIPIAEMNVEGLKRISEICFVAWNRYIIEEEGMYTVEEIQVK